MRPSHADNSVRYYMQYNISLARSDNAIFNEYLVFIASTVPHPRHIMLLSLIVLLRCDGFYRCRFFFIVYLS